MNPNDFAEGISSDETKDSLRSNTQFAIDKGAFGVPTYFLENEMFWGIDSIKFLIDSDLKEMECKEDVNRKYNENLQQALSETVFSHESTDSWYKNSEGKVVTTSPWLLKDYWKWTSSVNPEDFWFS